MALRVSTAMGTPPCSTRGGPSRAMVRRGNGRSPFGHSTPNNAGRGPPERRPESLADAEPLSCEQPLEVRMTTHPRAAQSNASRGDCEVYGLLAGASAGLLMGLYVAAAGLLAGQNLGGILAQFDPSPAPTPLTGML